MNEKLILPYLTLIFNKKTNDNILCLIQSVSKNYISYYSLSDLKEKDKSLLFAYADKWWKSASTLPISVYYKNNFNQFDYCKKYMNTSDCVILSGFEGITLKNLSEKRIKRKVIHLD